MTRLLFVVTVCLIVVAGCATQSAAMRTLEQLSNDLGASRAAPPGTYRYTGNPPLRPLRGTSRQVVRSILGPPDFCTDIANDCYGDEEDDACCILAPEWAYFYGPPSVTDNGDGTLTVEVGGIYALVIVFAEDQVVSEVSMRPQR